VRFLECFLAWSGGRRAESDLVTQGRVEPRAGLEPSDPPIAFKMLNTWLFKRFPRVEDSKSDCSGSGKVNWIWSRKSRHE
jgi:hypothetical protein